MSAEYGRFAGGLFMAVTRSGSNQIHGSLWEYLRNKSLNARNFFSTTKPDLKQNQFGFTLGGPIIRNRTFIFGSYQGTRIRQSLLFATAIPPTAAERVRRFLPIEQQARRSPHGPAVPQRADPSSRFDGVAAKLLDRFIPCREHLRRPVRKARARSRPGRPVSVAARPQFQLAQLAQRPLFPGCHAIAVPDRQYFPLRHEPAELAVSNWSLQDTHTFSPVLLNEFRIGVERFNSPTSALEKTQLSDFGAIYPGVNIPQMPNINTTGYFSLGSNDQFRDTGNIYRTRRYAALVPGTALDFRGRRIRAQRIFRPRLFRQPGHIRFRRLRSRRMRSPIS